MSDFLEGTANPVIDAFQSVLKQLNLPPLQMRFKVPSAETFFDNMRPATLHGPEEIHGLYVAATAYLNGKRENADGVWSGQPMREIVRIVNDLVEKSIRSYDIKGRWANGNPG